MKMRHTVDLARVIQKTAWADVPEEERKIRLYV